MKKVPESIDDALGLAIANLRGSAGMQQKELAEKMGISQAVLSRIETGVRPLKVSELVLASFGLRVTVESIYRDAVHILWRGGE